MNIMKLYLIPFIVVIGMLISPAMASAEDSLQELDKYFSQALQDWDVPGAAIAIVKDDKIIFSRGYGVRELGKSDPVTDKTHFAIGSSSKAFTSAALAMLVDEGKLDWDDPVTKYLPNFQLFDPSVTREIKVRDLLTHRIGIARADYIWGISQFDRDEVLYRTRFVKQADSFRYKYGYNNLMFLAAGQLIPAITGKSWDDFVIDRIFKPLGMNSSNTSTDAFHKDQNVATPHEWDEGKVKPASWRNIDNVGPAGSINSSVLEMAEWLRLQLGSGTHNGKKLLSTDVIDEMHSPQTVIPKGKWLSSMSPVNHIMVPESHFFAYGLAWFLQDYKGYKLVHHGGSIDGMRAMVGMIPELNLGIVILSNIRPNSFPETMMFKTYDHFIGIDGRDWSDDVLSAVKPMREKALAAAQKAKDSRVKGTKPSLANEEYAGRYYDCIVGEGEVSFKKGQLSFQSPLLSGPMDHWHYDSFQLSWKDIRAGGTPAKSLVTFTLNAKGEVNGFVAGPTNYKRIAEGGDVAKLMQQCR